MTSIYNVIAGRRVAPSGPASYQRENPSKPTTQLADYPLSGSANVDDAVSAAKDAFSAWRAISVIQRGTILRRAAELLRAELPRFADLLMLEIAKTRPEAEGEASAAANLLELYGHEAYRFGGETRGSTQAGTHLYTERRPHGVVGLISPWNYPLSIPVWKIAPALLCGNTAVWKPSLQHPLMSMAVIDLFERAGLPPGVVNLVHGDGEVAGQRIVDHPDVVAISFTGSRAVGDHIYAAASQRHARVSCEMGGKNALVVMPDADMQLAARCAVNGGLSFGGQKCTGTDLVMVHKNARGAFVPALTEAAAQLSIGDVFAKDTFYGPQVDLAQYRRVQERLHEASAGGARFLTGEPGEERPDRVIPPVIVDDCDMQSQLAQEEIFGPVMGLVTCDSLDQAIDYVNRSPYGLSASICTIRLDDAFRFADGVETGLAYVNRPTSGAEFHMPFGGVKASGHGMTEQGLKVLEFYSHWRTVAMQFS